MNDRLVDRRRGDLLLSTDRARIDQPAVLAMLHASHWGGQVTADILARSIANSLCVGVYDGTRQLAFARAVTDLSTFAYLTDVIVADDSRIRTFRGFCASRSSRAMRRPCTSDSGSPPEWRPLHIWSAARRRLDPEGATLLYSIRTAPGARTIEEEG